MENSQARENVGRFGRILGSMRAYIAWRNGDTLPPEGALITFDVGELPLSEFEAGRRTRAPSLDVEECIETIILNESLKAGRELGHELDSWSNPEYSLLQSKDVDGVAEKLAREYLCLNRDIFIIGYGVHGGRLWAFLNKHDNSLFDLFNESRREGRKDYTLARNELLRLMPNRSPRGRSLPGDEWYLALLGFGANN